MYHKMDAYLWAETGQGALSTSRGQQAMRREGNVILSSLLYVPQEQALESCCLSIGTFQAMQRNVPDPGKQRGHLCYLLLLLGVARL